MGNKFEKVSFGQYFNDMVGDIKDIPKEELENRMHEIYDDIKLPVRSTEDSAGYDFFAPEPIVISPGETIVIATGIKMQIVKNAFLALLPRSGHGFKYRLRLNNTVGIVDSDYYNNPKNEGHIFIKISNEGDKSLCIAHGEAFAQGIILPFLLTDDDAASNKRVGGIGSTSK